MIQRDLNSPKKCADKLALKINRRNKRYAESFEYYCNFYGGQFSKQIYDFYRINQLKSDADEGNTEAAYHLGEEYFYWQADYVQSRYWYKLAADQWLSKAEYSLAQFYEKGWGGSQDDSKAMELYQRAALHGSEGAQITLADKYFDGKNTQSGIILTKDDAQAAKWYEKVAEQGDRVSAFMIGMMYQQGLGVAKNYKKAILWYNRAIERGSRKAKYNLGLMLEIGQGLAKDKVKAKQYFQEACKEWIEEACWKYKKKN
ncbi:unnamed protein product [Commensalibacter papalotli (ex Botero et al. 2024)]|uniref:Sel1 repeat family protein n=2 Tax=Commensalibacter papalotli (ex Botero et al. 2024) TaxID=2972766 RepID=A0ABM9HK69_9PROT|nr:unnamed protein product [Commensalibacter papalotli (ex Botero et al. 2024)]